MGTTSVRMSMNDTKKMLVKDFCYSNDKYISKVISHANGIGGFWILRIVTNIKEMSEYFDIVFVMMSHRSGETSYKEIGYEMFPYASDVPLRWLEKVSPVTQEGKDWVAYVKRVQSVVIQSGKEIIFDGKRFKLVGEMSRKFWYVTEMESGKMYKLSKENIVDSILKEESENV